MGELEEERHRDGDVARDAGPVLHQHLVKDPWNRVRRGMCARWTLKKILAALKEGENRFAETVCFEEEKQNILI